MVSIFIIISGTKGIVFAEVPRLLNFQGRLLEDGTPVTADKDMSFSIWTDKATGTKEWEEVWDITTSQITVTNGIFNVLLGNSNPLASEIPTEVFTGENRWLQIEVEGELLGERQRIVSVGYAMKSQRVALPPRTYTGHADIDGNVSEKLYVHVDGALKSAKIHLWAEQLNPLFYTELGRHKHIATGGVVKSIGNHHSHAFNLSHVGSPWKQTRKGIYLQDSNKELVFRSIISSNDKALDAGGQFVHLHGFDCIKVADGGAHNHGFTQPTICYSRLSGTLAYTGGDKTFFSSLTVEITNSEYTNEDITVTIHPDSQGHFGPYSSDTEMTVEEGVDISTYLRNGKNKIVFKESVPTSGGKIRYNLYLEY